jgi:hypothetical protein
MRPPSYRQYLIAQHVLAIVGWTAPLGENNEVRTFTHADNGDGIPVIGGLGTPDEYNDPLWAHACAELASYFESHQTYCTWRPLMPPLALTACM